MKAIAATLCPGLVRCPFRIRSGSRCGALSGKGLWKNIPPFPTWLSFYPTLSHRCKANSVCHASFFGFRMNYSPVCPRESITRRKRPP